MKQKADVVAILMAAKLGVIVLFLIVLCAMSSCTPKSAMSTKVVVLDGYENIDISGGNYKYKVKFITYNVVDYVYTPLLFDQGDTIITHDKFRNQEIR
jgi:hypothetical protein